jgi:hypothetical protein
MARPKQYDAPLPTISAQVSPEIFEALDRIASEQSVPRQRIVRKILVDHLALKEAPAPLATAGRTTHEESSHEHAES